MNQGNLKLRFGQLLQPPAWKQSRPILERKRLGSKEKKIKAKQTSK